MYICTKCNNILRYRPKYWNNNWKCIVCSASKDTVEKVKKREFTISELTSINQDINKQIELIKKMDTDSKWIYITHRGNESVICQFTADSTKYTAYTTIKELILFEQGKLQTVKISADSHCCWSLHNITRIDKEQKLTTEIYVTTRETAVNKHTKDPDFNIEIGDI